MACSRVSGLSLVTVIPGTMWYMHEVSKDEASHWRTDTAKRHIPSKYTFPSMPWPIREDWNGLELLLQYVLELSYADGVSAEEETWRKSMRMIHSVPGIKPLNTCA